MAEKESTPPVDITDEPRVFTADELEDVPEGDDQTGGRVL